MKKKNIKKLCNDNIRLFKKKIYLKLCVPLCLRKIKKYNVQHNYNSTEKKKVQKLHNSLIVL